jgi:magnesium chelatase subunit I
LLDRFAHAVDVIGLADAKQRVEILRRRIFFEQDQQGFMDAFEDSEETLSTRISEARTRYSLVKYTDKDLYTIAALTASFKVDGHRADIVILRTARAQAAYDGRLQINDNDILIAAELALPHRMKKQPFQDSTMNLDQLQSNVRQARAEAEQEVGDGDESEGMQMGDAAADEKKA